MVVVRTPRYQSRYSWITAFRASSGVRKVFVVRARREGMVDIVKAQLEAAVRGRPKDAASGGTQAAIQSPRRFLSTEMKRPARHYTHLENNQAWQEALSSRNAVVGESMNDLYVVY